MITFRELRSDDFPLLHRWLNIDFVNKWYERRKFIYDDVERKYMFGRDAPVESYLINYDHEPIGYIQTYSVADYPRYAACVEAGEHVSGLDFFLGNADYIYQGFGKDILRLFLREKVFSNETVLRCIVGPEPSNAAAIRVYEKAGFSYFKTIQCLHEKEPEYLMMIRRAPVENIVFSDKCYTK